MTARRRTPAQVRGSVVRIGWTVEEILRFAAAEGFTTTAAARAIFDRRLRASASGGT